MLTTYAGVVDFFTPDVGMAHDARLRIKSRDIRDWPIVATALTLNCPIWTEDQDFFGTGLPTWATDRIHIYFETAAVR